jgi:phosphoenolpyruvate-protein kinase (PTS system EI component)
VTAAQTSLSPASARRRNWLGFEWLSAARTELREIVDRVASRAGEKEADIFRSQLLMLDDPLLGGAIKAAILNDACPAKDAVDRVVRDLAERFRALEDQRLQERAVDLGDVGQRLARNLSGARSTRVGRRHLFASGMLHRVTC